MFPKTSRLRIKKMTIPSTTLDQLALFRGLTPQELAWLTPRMYRQTYPAGSNIITAELPGEVVYFILSGTVKIYMNQPDGTDVILAILGPGDTVGEMSLLDSVGRCASVVTQEETHTLWMDSASFQECLRTHSTVTYNLVRILTNRVRMTNEQLQALASLNVYGRIARQLLAFAEKYGEDSGDGDISIPIRLTQSDLADLVGASRKRVNQVIVAYKRQEYISVSPDYRITVHNREALARLCREDQ